MAALTQAFLLSLFATLMLASFEARAVLKISALHGESFIEHPVDGARRSELCYLPAHLDSAAFSESDIDHEKGLCAIDVYRNTAACAKTVSTNPGLDIHKLPEGFTPAQLQAKNCKVADAQGKNISRKLAKYKLSTSCSYTPSILSYYHVSRLLGDVANVPVAVLRTMDLQNHLKIGAQALQAIARTEGQGALIYQTWSGLISALKAGAGGKNKDRLLVDDFTQSYGALVENPKDDVFYKEFFNGGTDRAATFRDRNAIFALLSKKVPVASLVGREFKQANVQKLVQLKDAADLIVLDTLLNQEDRFGNIHSLVKYYYRDGADLDSNGNPKLKTAKKLTPEIQALGAVEIREMLLKDNDCGVSRLNRAKTAKLAERIAHISPKTYSNLLRLDQRADSGEMKTFFSEQLLYTENDYTSVRKNLRELASLLKKACQSGALKLDLDLDAHFGANSAPVPNCEGN